MSDRYMFDQQSQESIGNFLNVSFPDISLGWYNTEALREKLSTTFADGNFGIFESRDDMRSDYRKLVGISPPIYNHVPLFEAIIPFNGSWEQVNQKYYTKEYGWVYQTLDDQYVQEHIATLQGREPKYPNFVQGAEVRLHMPESIISKVYYLFRKSIVLNNVLTYAQIEGSDEYGMYNSVPQCTLESYPITPDGDFLKGKIQWGYMYVGDRVYFEMKFILWLELLNCTLW